jgi:hypothetical protein
MSTKPDDDVPLLIARPAPAPPQAPPPVAKSGAETMAQMDRVNADAVTMAYKVMGARGPKFEAQPSVGNAGSWPFQPDSMTFARADATSFRNSPYMQARRPPGQT